ncbi:MAG: S8 family serine peptidase [Actinobacteria bacterium]|nr:S8 family serine peptidase [Actinomycetota bacterium]
MPDDMRPAWSRDSIAVRLPGVDALDDLSPEWAWGGATGEGMRVAIVDSGIDADHPGLDGCVDRDGGVVFEKDDEGAVTAVPGPHDDSFGHGTACAGIIHSLAPAARITSVKVLGTRLTGTSDVFHAGLHWAVEHRFDVINLSLGTRKRDWALRFHDVCDAAYFNGCFITTAANNIDRVTYPSLYASVASVASNLSKDPFRFHHNPEPPTEFLAPGIDIEVPWLGHTTITTTGNSFAAPHIAGIAALVRSKHPELRPFQLKTVLWACSANVQEAAAMQAGRLSRLSRMAHRPTGAVRSTALHTLNP